MNKNNKTTAVNSEKVERKWQHIDAKDRVLGKLATEVSKALIGKDKPNFSYRANVGDYVVVINTDKITVTGNKLRGKVFYRHSGYPKGLRSRTLEEALAKDPTKVLRNAVSGMLPQNKLKKVRLRNLKIYTGEEHPHKAQLSKSN